VSLSELAILSIAQRMMRLQHCIMFYIAWNQWGIW